MNNWSSYWHSLWYLELLEDYNSIIKNILAYFFPMNKLSRLWIKLKKLIILWNHYSFIYQLTPEYMKKVIKYSNKAT